MKRLWMAALVMVVVVAGGAEVLAQEEVAPVALEPRDVLAKVTFPRIGASLDNLRAFVNSALGDMPDVLTPQFSRLVHSEGLIGVRQDGAVSILLLNPKKVQASDGGAPVPYALIIPVVEAGEYFKSVELTMPRKEPEDGMEVFVQEQRRFDFMAFREATPEERENRNKFMVVSEINHYFLPAADNQVVYGREPAAVKAVADFLNGGVLKVSAEGEADAVVRVDADVVQVMDIFQDDIDKFLKTLPMMAMTGAPDMPGRLPAQVQAKILKVQMEALVAAARQFTNVTVEVGADRNRIRLSNTVACAEDSVARKFLDAQRADGARGFVGALPQDCVAAVAGQMREVHLLTESLMELWAKINEEVALAGHDEALMSAEALTLMGESLGQYEGAVAFGIPESVQPGFSFVFVGEVKDPEKARTILAKTLAADSPMLKMYEQMNMKLKVTPAAAEYKGVSIDRLEMSVEGLPEEAMGMVKQLYGDMAYEHAIVDRFTVGAFGKNAGEMMRKMIDVARGDAPSLARSEQYQAAVADLPPDRIAEGFLSVSSLLSMVSRMGLPGMQPMEIAPARPVSMSITVREHVLKADAYVPADEVKSVYTAFMQAMMGAMQGGGH